MSETEEFQWINPPATPWPVPVLDVRPLTLSVTSWANDEQAAKNAMSYGREDGLAFIGQEPPTARRVSTTLRYRVDPVLADGSLFRPSTMEHKWALFCHDGKILFVRSWKRSVLLIAHFQQQDRTVELSAIEGAIADPNEDQSFTEAAVDFIIRTHVLRSTFPAPLPSDPGPELKAAAMFSFNLFGNFAQFATHHRFTAMPPDQPLRSNSLFHIGVARNDIPSAQAQLDRGVPVDLLAGDGLTAMHWALATRDLNTLAWLLARGLSVDARSIQGATALMNAVQGNDAEAVRWLLAHGADPNAADNRLFTSLHRAAETGTPALVRLLLDSGANTDATANGHTPLSLARSRGNHEIAAMLEK